MGWSTCGWICRVACNGVPAGGFTTETRRARRPQMRPLALLLGCTLLAPPAARAQQRPSSSPTVGVAVPPFVAVPNDTSALPAAATAAAILRGLVRADSTLRLVTRYDSAAANPQLDSARHAARSGRLVGARYLILGAVARPAGGGYRLDLRLVFTETGDSVARDSAKAPDPRAFQGAVADAGRALLRNLRQRERRP